MKYHIEKNTVKETLVIPLYGRKVCSEIYPNLFYDETSIKIIDQIDYDFTNLMRQAKKIMYRFGFLEVAMRQNDLAWEINEYLKAHPEASVVNLGCGLDDTGRRCDNGKCKIYNVDFPNVIDVRNELLPPGDREKNIACDLNDPKWFKEIDNHDGAIFFASGVFYYFLTEDLQKLVIQMAEAFPNGRLVFDAANKKASKLLRKTWLKAAKIKNVGAYFAVSNAKKEIEKWSKKLSVSSRGYMLGYNDLKDPQVSKFFRFLAKLGDNFMKMQIVNITFKGDLSDETYQI